MCLADSFQETQLVFSGDLYRSTSVIFQRRPPLKTTKDSALGHPWWRGCSLGKGVMEYNAAICIQCPLLKILCTTDVITLWSLPSLLPNTKHLLPFFFSFPESEGKEGCGDRDFQNLLFLFVLQSPSRVWTYAVWRRSSLKRMWYAYLLCWRSKDFHSIPNTKKK